MVFHNSMNRITLASAVFNATLGEAVLYGRGKTLREDRITVLTICSRDLRGHICNSHVCPVVWF
jgi:hypothetical protein